ncbi:hypothetical protein H8B02_09245 [Bradyrhizobium sp. Pear77]|nr:hypothetical protein [Bradyrhizobium altum]
MRDAAGDVSATYSYDTASQLTGITYANGSTALGTLSGCCWC